MSFVHTVISILVFVFLFCLRFVCFNNTSNSVHSISVFALLTTLYIFIQRAPFKFQPGASDNLNPPLRTSKKRYECNYHLLPSNKIE